MNRGISHQKKILVVEDEEDIRDILLYNLEKSGYQVMSSPTGEEGVKAVRHQEPDLVLLDIMLPGLSGLDVCRILKAHADTAKVPVIMVTAKGEEDDIIKGLELGADDYITKPFKVREVMARIATVFRRSQTASAGASRVEKKEIAPFTWYPEKASIVIENNELVLTPSEYKLMELMLSKPGWVFTRNQIMEYVKGDDTHSTSRAIDVVVVGLRKKLKKFEGDIQTVRGIGYRLKVQEGEA